MSISTALAAHVDDAEPCELPERNLWNALLELAMRDLKSKDKATRRRARYWFRRERISIGSFLWVAAVLELDAGVVRRSVLAH